MNKLSYGNFDSSNDDIAFSSVNGYNTPANEVAVRKQLSYPLKELKTFLNNTAPIVEGTETVIQLVASANGMKYRTQPNGALTSAGPAIYSGTTEPSSSLGNDGDIYFLYEE